MTELTFPSSTSGVLFTGASDTTDAWSASEDASAGTTANNPANATVSDDKKTTSDERVVRMRGPLPGISWFRQSSLGRTTAGWAPLLMTTQRCRSDHDSNPCRGRVT